MPKDKWTALSGMALKTRLVLTQERSAAAFKRLLNICASALDRHPDMGIMAIGAAHFALWNRVVVRQLKFRAHFQVALEAGIGRFSWVDNLAWVAAALDMQTSRTVAGFAAHVLGVVSRCFQTRMRRGPKIPRN